MSEISVSENSKLSKTQVLQIFVLANEWAKENEKKTSRNLPGVIKKLKDDSEGGDLILDTFKYEGVKYSRAIIYPGGNSFGIIFKDNKPIAKLKDSDVYCN